ncbi:MAG: MFS transporter [Myxococcales bacterium]|nr:MFS transporter [Myxococcales bacterium]
MRDVATPISIEQRRWRIRVFTATWLSYVGFYFCRKPFSAAKSAIGTEAGWDATTLGNIWAAYLIAYAIGQFLASGMATRFGPRRNVLVGMALSVAVTLAMGLIPTVEVMLGLVVVNGLAQATGWSGNVGTMAGWFHKQERGRVMGLWSTNFVVGALTSGWVMGWVLALRDAGAPEPWRLCFFVGASVLAVVWVQYLFNQRNRPEDVGLLPIADPETAHDLAAASEPSPPEWLLGLSRGAWVNVLLIGGCYFFIKFIRYAIWSWSAYFLQENFHLSGARANLYATLFDAMGMLGVLATGWLSDRYFGSRRSGIALIMVVGMTIATALLMAVGGASVGIFALLLGLVGATLYGPDAILTGAGVIDIGGRRAAMVAGIVSGIGSLGPIVQELVIARLYDAKGGELGPIFALLFGSAAMATLFCAALVWRNHRGGRGV